MDALVDEDLAKKDSVVDLLENKVVLIKPKDGETKVTGFENITDADVYKRQVLCITGNLNKS